MGENSMYPESNVLNNDRGSIMVVALLLLVFLTIIGITATNNTRMELNVTRNSQVYKRDFYVADSGWRAAAMNLQGFGLNFPNYGEEFEAGGTLNGISYNYIIPNDETTSTKAAGSSGSMGCKDVTFSVTSQALDPEDPTITTQEIHTRLVKLCCGSYN